MNSREIEIKRGEQSPETGQPPENESKSANVCRTESVI